MFLKTISLFLAFSVFSAQAQVATHQDLKKVVDEFQYSLTVEWDQKDKSFYDAQMRKFQKSIETLQAQGMTDIELLDYLKASIKDQRVSKDLDQLYQQVSLGKTPRSEIQKLVKESLSKTYEQGANWNGNGTTTVTIAAAAILVAVLIFVIVSKPKNETNTAQNGDTGTGSGDGGSGSGGDIGPTIDNPPHGYCYDANNCKELESDPYLNWVQACQPNWVCTE